MCRAENPEKADLERKLDLRNEAWTISEPSLPDEETDGRDKTIHIRQDMYLRAVRTLPTVHIFEGKFSIKHVPMGRLPEIGCQRCDSPRHPVNVVGQHNSDY